MFWNIWSSVREVSVQGSVEFTQGLLLVEPTGRPRRLAVGPTLLFVGPPRSIREGVVFVDVS